MKGTMVHKVAFWLGIAIVVASHIYMLVAGLPEAQMMGHAVLNLVAAAFILFSVR